eukprot:gene19585-biopygen25939
MLEPGDRAEPTLQQVQVVSTIPEAFPRRLNTCGRITAGNCAARSPRKHCAAFYTHHNPRYLGVLLTTVGGTPRGPGFANHRDLLATMHSDTPGGCPAARCTAADGTEVIPLLYVLVSNRGHDSIAVYGVDTSMTRGQ